MKFITGKPTVEGAKLELTSEQEEKLQFIYQEDQQEPGRYRFQGFFDPESADQVKTDQIVVPLRSVYNGTFLYTNRDTFANVIGSTGDPCPESSWIELLRLAKVSCTQCMTDGVFYDSRDHSGRTYFKDYHCGGSLVGGHVVNSFSASSVNPGGNLYLLPICHNHNSCCTDYTGRNGSGFYMMPRFSGTGVKLKQYFYR